MGCHWGLEVAALGNPIIKAVVGLWASYIDKYWILDTFSPRYKQLFGYLTGAKSEAELDKIVQDMAVEGNEGNIKCPVLLTAGGFMLAFGPWVWRMMNDLSEERRSRIRTEERAEMADAMSRDTDGNPDAAGFLAGGLATAFLTMRSSIGCPHFVAGGSVTRGLGAPGSVKSARRAGRVPAAPWDRSRGAP